MRAQTRLLGVFPSLDDALIGGVQTSGRLAWEALKGQSDERHLFCYGGPCGRAAGGEESSWAEDRVDAVLQALKGTLRGDVGLFWHIGLLRMLALPRVHVDKVAVFLHGVDAWESQSWLTSRLLSRVDLFLSNTSFTWEGFLRLHPGLTGAAHQVVALGIGEPQKEHGDPDPTPSAVMIGRLLASEDYKGHREMIQAWPDVRERTPGAELWIVGEGDLRPALERLAADLGLASSVKFFGAATEQEKTRLLERSRCLALPSRGEGFGLVYLEAMRLGRPCLVSTLDAGREVIDPPRAGLSADPRNRQDLVEATCRLLGTGEEWRQMSSGARALYEDTYTVKHFQARLLSSLGPWLLRS